MQWIDFLAQSPLLFLICMAFLGLMIGSFLNVVILRLPQMLYAEWDAASQSPNSAPNATASTLEIPKSTAHFNLVTPGSHCPHCSHRLGIWENIPLISFIALKGRCRACHHSISWRYPIIEIVTAIFSIFTALHFGFTSQTAMALILTWTLIALTVIDIEHHLLPDDLTLPLLWLGLFLNTFQMFTDLTSSVMGAIAGYLFLWTVFWLFKLCTGKEGMGYGDFKLLAMLGAWLGWQSLPCIILLASLVGTVAGVFLIVAKGHKRSQPYPFGPFLAVAGWSVLVWGDKIPNFYQALVL